MDDERELLYFKMQMLQAEIKMQGMIAENKHRELSGKQIIYGEKDFNNLIEEYGIYHNNFPMHNEYER